MPAPNILYLHSHDTGRHVQPYGQAVATPNLQRLAGQGVLFRSAFCGAPTCSPSRACLLTGMDAHSNGMIGLAHRGFGLKDHRQHLVHTLRDAGYLSALAGVQHVAKDVSSLSYDRVLGNPRVAEEVAAEFLRGPAREQPFFLSVGFFETHREFPEPGPEDDPRYGPAPGNLPDTAETRRDMAGFAASVRILDMKMGKVLAALDDSGLADNTLVICTTDHGMAFPGMKCTLTDAGIGVMLIMRGPGGFGGGRVCDSLVSQIDLFPTVCDLAGIEPPPWLQGTSLLPLAAGRVAEVRDEIRAEVTYHAAYEPMRCVRTRRHKYIRRFGQRKARVILPNCDDSLSKSVLIDHGWSERSCPEQALFDLVFDPYERLNLAGTAAGQESLDQMRQRLHDWMRETNDPLLDGPVPAPDGALVNDPDGLSPQEDCLPANRRQT